MCVRVCVCVRVCAWARVCMYVCISVYVDISWSTRPFLTRGIIFLDFASTVGLIFYFWKNQFFFIAIFEFSKFLFSIFLIFRTNIVYILWILCMQDKILYNLKKKSIAVVHVCISSLWWEFEWWGVLCVAMLRQLCTGQHRVCVFSYIRSHITITEKLRN